MESDEYSGRIALLSEGVIGAALMYRGYSYNSVDPAQIKEMRDMVRAGLVLNLIGVVLITVLFFALSARVLGLDLEVLPAWAAR